MNFYLDRFALKGEGLHFLGAGIEPFIQAQASSYPSDPSSWFRSTTVRMMVQDCFDRELNEGVQDGQVPFWSHGNDNMH